jgi:hypothetical protein
VEEGRLAYRVRTAETGDAKTLKSAITTTLAHPEQQGRRESYSGAAGRGDILVLERYDRQAHEWNVAGFVECHMRVDDNLSIRDVGTTGDQPQTGVVRYLLDQAFNSFRPAGAQVKIRRDARTWLDIFRGIAGFYLEGEEYRRPHYWTIWRWDSQHAREAEQAAQQPAPQPQRPRPPQPPGGPPRAPALGNGQMRPLGPRPSGPRPVGPRPTGPRPAGPSTGPRRAGPPGGARPIGPSTGPRRPGPPKGARPAGPAGGRQPGPQGPSRPPGPPRSRGPRRPRPPRSG